jgi:hypothetical protein
MIRYSPSVFSAKLEKSYNGFPPASTEKVTFRNPLLYPIKEKHIIKPQRHGGITAPALCLTT